MGGRLIFIKHVLYFRHCAGLDFHHCKMRTIASTLRMRILSPRVSNFPVAICSLQEAQLILLDPRTFVFCCISRHQDGSLQTSL